MLDRRNWRRMSYAALAAMALVGAWIVLSPVRAAPPAETQPADGTIKITILHVNDTHGRLEPWDKDGRSVGGYARLSTLVGEIRSAGDAARVFLVHAGDEISKGDELTSKTAGKANLSLMNHLKFDLMTPGNGEFYDGLRAIETRIKEAGFPFLTANIIVKSSGQRLARPFVIDKAQDVRVAFLGLCSLRTSLPSAWPFKVEDPIETAKKYVPQLRKEADIVVAVTHIGEDLDEQLAKTVPGIDLVIGGHSHTVLEKGRTVKGPDGRDVLICQTGEFLEYLGRVDLTVKPIPPTPKPQDAKFRLASASARLIALDQKVKLDPEVTAMVARMSGATSQPATGRSTSAPSPVKVR